MTPVARLIPGMTGAVLTCTKDAWPDDGQMMASKQVDRHVRPTIDHPLRAIASSMGDILPQSRIG
jgi:hypothetical protein